MKLLPFKIPFSVLSNSLWNWTEINKSHKLTIATYNYSSYNVAAKGPQLKYQK